MKIIIAPSKAMKYTDSNINTTIPKYLSKQKKLHKQMKSFSVNDIHDIMGVSFKIANEVYNYYHQNNPKGPALFYYSGIVFKQLKLSNYTKEDFDYMDKHLNIMSAYYGVLKHSDIISYYRLDMLMKLPDMNLYDYWHKDIKNYFKKEDMLIFLLSKEFAKAIDHHNIITIDFLENRGGKLVHSAIFLKMARGKILNLMIKNKITNLEEIKKLSFDGYSYDESLSTKTDLVFVRIAPKRYKQL